MKSRFLIALPLVGSLALASCYPIRDNPRETRGPRPNSEDQNISSQDQQKIREQRDRMKERDERKEEIAERNDDRTPDRQASDPKPTTTKTTEYPVATPVVGKKGLVLSPYNAAMVDVRGIPSGTLVTDPTFPASEKKYFRVP